MSLERITLLCFAASYALALALEGLQLAWPGRVQRLLSLSLGGAGLAAHTLFLAVQRPPLSSQFGSMLFLAWILAVFYFYGSIHHRRLAWGIFVLPVVLGLCVLARVFDRPPADAEASWRVGFVSFQGESFWNVVHGGLLLLAAVGVCVGFVASVMYLVHARQLKAKLPPDQGVRLLSLERLEEINRRAINLAFPLLTVGLLVGVALMVQDGRPIRGLADPKIVSAGLLWLVFALLLYLRYGYHLRGRRVAWLTIVTFALLLFTLVLPTHSFVPGVGP
jgi:ABC-type transport system involved in cytochrome c biogenesis permease subunit